MKWTPLLIFLTMAYFFVCAVTTYDIRIIQWKRSGELPPDSPELPEWIAIFAWLQWGIFGTLLYLNWKYAIFLFIAKFILKVLPVLEIIGAILTLPIKKKRKAV